MEKFVTYEQIQEAVQAIRQRATIPPRVGLILGSGLGGLADAVQDATAIPYPEIPHFPQATVVGHAGRLVIGHLESQPVMVMQGRAHYYEGYSMAQVTFPVRVMQAMDVEILIVTNAAGGLNPDFRAGDLMLITDHINLIGMAGLNPLRGPNLDQFGPRFPPMTQAYDPELSDLARRAAAEAGIPLREGIYICLAGPSFETPADIRFLQQIGADAVGMSTVPEVTVACHGGTRVLGISGISNVAVASPGETEEPSHEEVLEAAQLIVPRLSTIIRGVLRAL